jgi:hypothetical protein
MIFYKYIYTFNDYLHSKMDLVSLVNFWKIRVHSCLDRLPKVLTETGSDQVLDLCRSAERISQYRPEDADSGVALRLRMLIRALIAPWTRHPQARPFRQLLLAKGLFAV